MIDLFYDNCHCVLPEHSCSFCIEIAGKVYGQEWDEDELDVLSLAGLAELASKEVLLPEGPDELALKDTFSPEAPAKPVPKVVEEPEE